MYNTIMKNNVGNMALASSVISVACRTSTATGLLTYGLVQRKSPEQHSCFKDTRSGTRLRQLDQPLPTPVHEAIEGDRGTAQAGVSKSKPGRGRSSGFETISDHAINR